MLKIRDEGIILEKTDLDFESKAVLNPACIRAGDTTHMFYRAVGQDNISSIGYAKLKDNKVVKRLSSPVLFPEADYEIMGIEDPRITLLDGTYYLTYTAFDGINARVAYAVSSDLVSFNKKGLISPSISYNEVAGILRLQNLNEGYFISKLALEKAFKGLNYLWEKDTMLFPQKINGKFALLHRIRPDIQIIYFDDFGDLTDDFWRSYLTDLEKYIVLRPKFRFENKYIGSGAPPIKTPDGWLLIYHAIEEFTERLTYRACAALLDLNDPTKVIGRLNKPLFSPKESWEKTGNVDNVVFPNGAVVDDDRFYIYYGAADSCIGAKSLPLSELLEELKTEGI